MTDKGTPTSFLYPKLVCLDLRTKTRPDHTLKVVKVELERVENEQTLYHDYGGRGILPSFIR